MRMSFVLKIIFTSGLLATSNLYAETCNVNSKHANVPNIIEQQYHQARKHLLLSGWQPLRTLNYNTARDQLMYSGNGLSFWEKGYVELANCAGTGSAPCKFNFKDIYGNTLEVYTSGEDNPREKYYAHISNIDLSCKTNN